MDKFIQDIHFDCDTIWKKEYVDNQLLTITNNEDLLDFVIGEQDPDDYDGFYTTKGEWRAKKSLQFLKWKLKEIGWL